MDIFSVLKTPVLEHISDNSHEKNLLKRSPKLVPLRDFACFSEAVTRGILEFLELAVSGKKRETLLKEHWVEFI